MARNADRYFSGYKPVIKERKLPLANFLLFGTEKCIECHQTLPLCEGAGQRQTKHVYSVTIIGTTNTAQAVSATANYVATCKCKRHAT